MSKPNKQSTLVFFVNGKKVEDNLIEPEWTLLYYLRNKLKLSGTKLGCGEGGCGACTVMVSKYDRKNDKINHLAVNACLVPVCSLHGNAVTTVEGIGNMRTKLHPVQETIAKAHGSQCGFCTPGIVMSMYTLLRNNPKPSVKSFDTTFQGNLCRCTGYRPIIQGYNIFTEEWELCQQGPKMNGNVCGMGTKCCKNQQNMHTNEMLFDKSAFQPYNETQETIFPPELLIKAEYDNQRLVITGKNVKWLRPNTLEELLEIKHRHPDAKLIVGNTEAGVETKFRRIIYPILVQPSNVSELSIINETKSGLKIGAAVTLEQMETALRAQMKTKDPEMTRIFASIVDMLYYFAGKQIRNVAAVGGNIMTSSPISDLNPIFMSANCVLDVCDLENGYRKVTMDDTFFTGYRKNRVGNKEILVAINIPYTTKDQYFYAYKQAKRRDDDIAIVNAAVNITFEDNTTKIQDAKIAYGGMAPTTIMALDTQNRLAGKVWNEETLEEVFNNLVEDLPISPSAPGGNIHYRQSLTLSLFYRAYLAISQQLQLKGFDVSLPDSHVSGITGFHHKVPKGTQIFQLVPETQSKSDYVGRPIPHIRAFEQTCGEALYCDDNPSYHGELYMALVLSTEAYAEIVSINADEALCIDGVVAFFSAIDVDPIRNHVGPVFHDEEMFVSKTVTSKGQIIGAIIAENQTIAQLATKKVKVEYKKLSPVIITIEDAIKHESFFNKTPTIIKKGDVNESFKNACHIIEGECRTGAQEHFYLETHCAIANPKENCEIEIICSTQHPSEINKLVAHVLGIPINRVVTKTKRLGGGFGGKESRAMLVSLPAAFAAHKLRKPIRCMLDRDEDMMISGARHPFLMKYKTAFNADGKIEACKIDIYNNAGYSADLSFAVCERAMFHFENAYHIPNVEVRGYVCKTNLPSNTAFRGFGGPQGMFAGENMIRDIADKLGKDPIEIQQINLYKEGDLTHYNQKLEYCTMDRCWTECLKMADYCTRKEEIEKFNCENRWKKRGIAMVPTKFGIAFTVLFLNQAGALVIVYTDGSVLLSHGGVEMGQGLHTKMIQVASRVLDIPVDGIHITETSTDKVPNTSATAASAGSDLNGMAVKEACEKIMERITPYKNQKPNGTWKEWVDAAYKDRVSLSATGFYATPDIGYSFETNSGKPFNYFTYGAACSEVEIDCLTGDHQVLRTDIVMDLGESLNPAIDVGQIEGGFVQGYGLFTMEEMIYSPQGDIFTKGPGAYKLPGFGDIPVQFNVALLKGAPNPRAVFSSKAVGEPPLFLSSSILFAIKEAIKSARYDACNTDLFRLNAPATSARIRTLCEDHLTGKFCTPDPTTYTPWNVIP